MHYNLYKQTGSKSWAGDRGCLEVDEPVIKKGKFLPARAMESRRKMPTSFIDGKLQINARVARSRRKQTYEAAI